MATQIASFVSTYFPSAQIGAASCVLAAEGGSFSFDPNRWAPAAAGDATPFEQDEWDARFDPEVNAWMASVVWSIGGWRAWPQSCAACAICDVPGGPIPHPRNPIGQDDDVEFSPSLAALHGVLIVALGAIGLARIELYGRVL